MREAELFVMVMGASNYTFAEATLSQKLTDFVASTIRGFEYFGAVPKVIVPDQLGSAVKGPDRYEPDINATYLEMAEQLWRCRAAGEAAKAEGQGQSGKRGAHSAALDPGSLKKPHVF